MSEPLYIKLSDIKSFKGNMTLLVYNLVKEISTGGVLCIQKYRGVYKIYVKDDRDKTSLLIYGVKYDDRVIDIYEINPYEAKSSVYVIEKVTIKNLPFHVTNEHVLSELEGY